MTKKIMLTILAMGIFLSCFAQSSNFFERVKIDAKLFSGCNTTFIISDNSTGEMGFGGIYADYLNKIHTYTLNDYIKKTTFSYSGGLEASLRYAFEDSKSEISLGLGYLYQPITISFYIPGEDKDGKIQRARKNNKFSQFHYLDLPINWYYNLNKGLVLNAGISYKTLLNTNISENLFDHGTDYFYYEKEDYTYHKNKYSLILGIGNRITKHLSIFLKTNLDAPGFIRVKKTKPSTSFLPSRTYSNINTCLYLTYTF